MKTIKKVFAMFLAVVMVMGLSVTAFAADAGTYTITINDAVSGETYNAYKIFDATQSTSTSYVVDENGTYYYDTDTNSYVTEEPTNSKKDENDTVLKYAQVTSEHYSYTISSGSAWFKDILLYMGGGTTAATADTTTGVYTGKGLTLTPSGADSTVYVVTATVLGEGEEADEDTTYFSVAEFAAFLNTKTTGKTAAASAKATSTTVTLDVSTSEAGYYFVDTSLGSLCSLDSVVGTAQVIYEKNAVPSITKYVLDDDNNSTHVFNTTEDWNNWEKQEFAVLDVIDTVYYKLVVNTGSDDYSATDGTGVDANYVIVDTLPTGIVLNGTTVNGVTTYDVVITTGTGDDQVTWTQDATTTEGDVTTITGGYTVSYDTEKNELTITLLASGKLATLAESTEITITYNAKMVADADADTTDVTVNGNNINNVSLSYHSQTSTSQANVKTYQLVPTVTVEGEEQPAFVKVDGTTNSPLAGVKFVLSRTVNGTTQYAVVTNGYLAEWTTDRDGTDGNATDATKLTTNDDGTFNVKGLDAGTYILTETDTLDGYNKLTDTITVVIAADGGVTYQYTSKIGTEGNQAGSTITVVNETGTELPSTGGIGTTIFYVVGTVMVISAAVLLITRRRMNATRE